LPDALRPVSDVGRHPLSREIVEGHQRDRVLAVAIDVFAERGYRGTNVRHIVSAAKIGSPTFQSLFGDKQGCFLLAYDRIVAAARVRIQAAVEPGESWRERVRDTMRALLELIEESPLEAQLVLVEAQTAGDLVLEHYQANLEEIAGLVRQGRVQSDFGAELPDTLDFAVVGGLFWFLQQRIAQGEAARATALLPEVMEIVATPYLGQEATRELIATPGEVSSRAR
jgi:AcrR family transcriptional regulator